MPFLLWGYGLVGIFSLLIISYEWIVEYSYHRGPVYKPTPPPSIETFLELAALTTTDIVVDLGSGDGRLLIAVAKQGVHAIGYEINPFLFLQSRWNIRKAGLHSRITVHFGSMYRADLSKATVIFTYSFPTYLPKLQQLFFHQLNHPARIISVDYPFKDWPVRRQKNFVYLYHWPLPKRLHKSSALI